jgi:hypothetical protein
VHEQSRGPSQVPQTWSPARERIRTSTEAATEGNRSQLSGTNGSKPVSTMCSFRVVVEHESPDSILKVGIPVLPLYPGYPLTHPRVFRPGRRFESFLQVLGPSSGGGRLQPGDHSVHRL